MVEISFLNTIGILNKISCPFGVISPSQSILRQSKQFGAILTFQDSGFDLNAALSDAVQILPQNQSLLIVMPDLPFLNQVFFEDIFKNINDREIIIIPSISQNNDFGTAALYLKRPNMLKFNFGMRSSRHFQVEAELKGLDYKILNLSPYSRDLDTPEDIKYLRQNINQVIEPKQYMKILNKIDSIAHP
jgi:2-phospho-L-lactate guanylyltransferase (CobY/MobA/RfbA family)